MMTKISFFHLKPDANHEHSRLFLSPISPLSASGLIGGSFMLDLKRLGLVQSVTGIDTNADNLNYASSTAALSTMPTNICAESIGHADLVLIATPVSVLPEYAARHRLSLKKRPAFPMSAAPNNRHSMPSAPTCPSACRNVLPPTRFRFGSKRRKIRALRFVSKQPPDHYLARQGASDGLRRLKSLWQAVGSPDFHHECRDEHDNIFLPPFSHRLH